MSDGQRGENWVGGYETPGEKGCWLGVAEASWAQVVRENSSEAGQMRVVLREVQRTAAAKGKRLVIEIQWLKVERDIWKSKNKRVHQSLHQGDRRSGGSGNRLYRSSSMVSASETSEILLPRLCMPILKADDALARGVGRWAALRRSCACSGVMSRAAMSDAMAWSLLSLRSC